MWLMESTVTLLTARDSCGLNSETKWFQHVKLLSQFHKGAKHEVCVVRANVTPYTFTRMGALSVHAGVGRGTRMNL